MFKQWRRRFFVLLTNGQMMYFKSELARSTAVDSASSQAQGSIDVKQALTVSAPRELQGGDKSGRRHKFVVSTSGREYVLSADSQYEQGEWIRALNIVRAQFG